MCGHMSEMANRPPPGRPLPSILLAAGAHARRNGAGAPAPGAAEAPEPGARSCRTKLLLALIPASALALLAGLAVGAATGPAASLLLAVSGAIAGALTLWAVAALREAGGEEAGEDPLREHSEQSATIMLDPAGCLVTWNPDAVRLARHGPDEVIGQHVSCLYPNEDVERGDPDRHLQAARARGRVDETGWRRRKDGTLFLARVVTTRLLDDAGALCGFSAVIRDVTARRRLEDVSRLRERERAARLRVARLERRSAFLADAASLLESATEPEATLENVVRLAVPEIADWAFIEMLGEDGTVHRPAVAHADPAKEAVLREYEQRLPIAPRPGDASAARTRAARAELVREITPAALAAVAEDPAELEVMRELGATSAMVVPLRVRGLTLGELTLVSSDRRCRYDGEDLEMARELAARCAVAFDNARLWRESRSSSEHFRLLVEGADDYAIFSLDPEGRVLDWNEGAERLTGYGTEAIAGQHFSRFYMSGDIREGRPQKQLDRALAAGRCEEEGWRVRADGSRFFAKVSVTPLWDDTGRARGYSCLVRDITERRQLDAQLAEQALHDPLTGLPNRNLFVDRAAQALVRLDRRDVYAALIFVDLDRFKLVNDSLGHAAGDLLLVEVAARLAEAVRLEDTVSRFGGDEFTVLCEDLAGEEEAIAIAKRIAEAFEAPFEVEGQEFVVSCSLGIALTGDEEATPETLLRDADTAMYHAKRQGGGRYQVFDAPMRSKALERVTTESALRRAIEEQALDVVYQPLVDLRASRVVGVEALVRWDHPERGELQPRQFIPMAEETGLIHAIGAFVLETACRQAGTWTAESPDDGPLTTFVNLSARQLARPGFAGLVERTLSETGTDPAALCLEITESVLLSQSRTTLSSLRALRDLGVHLAIDDFGIGYSSLSYLKRFPIDYLKVDSSFVEGLGRRFRSDDSALVEAMMTMAHALGLTVIAEGVEEAEQLAELRNLGCELAQGYYLTRPQSADALHELLTLDRRWEPAAATTAAR